MSKGRTYRRLKLPLINLGVFLFCFILLSFSSVAQVVIMPAQGNGDTTMSYAEVYDDGGSSAPYSSSCNASYTFHTVSSTGRYIIEVYSYLTHPQGNASLTINNGLQNNGSTICLFPGSAYGKYYSSENTVTIHFTADDDYPTDGFKIVLCEYDNAVPPIVHYGFIDSNTTYLYWFEEDTSVNWTLDYAVVCDYADPNTYFDTGTFSTVSLDTSYYVVSNIPVGCNVIYRVFSASTGPCTRYDIGTSGAYSEPQSCPCIIPTEFTYTSLQDSIVLTWTCDTVVEFWHIWCPFLSLDTTLPGNVFQLTIPYDFPCFTDLIYINGNCYSMCKYNYIMLPQGGCHQSVFVINRISTSGSTVTLSWIPVSDLNSKYLLYYRKNGQPQSSNIFVDTIPADVSTYTVGGLMPHTRYIFTIVVLCGGTVTSCESTSATINTTLDNCIDFIDFYDNENVHLTWGTYSNPMMYTVGGSGRHVAMLDTNEYDQNTGGALRCIPYGEEVSLRLGDDNVGARGETITFDYLVDSLDKDMLVLEYAVVLQNPNHNVANQPHFTMEILDGNGSIIDTNCCYADFFAAGDMGWNTVSGSNVIWKDWTTVGIDIAPYHGQNIKIRFTTKDCADGGHYGYAYLTIRCDSKRIDLVNLCDAYDSVRLRAPLGFEYQWTHGTDPTVISTNNEIVVPADSSTYHCHASFVGKPDCSFTINSVAILPVPVADMHYTIDTCSKIIHFFSDSYVSIDSAYMPYVKQTIDSLVWNIAGVVFYGDSVSFRVDSNGTYSVTLFCKLSDSFCGDSASRTVDVGFFHTSTISGPSAACYGDSVTLHADLYPADAFSLQWDDASTDSLRVISIYSDTIIYLYSDYGSCKDTLSHYVHVNRLFDDTTVIRTCLLSIDTMGFHAEQSGVYSILYQDINGCDSLVSLALTINPSYYDTTFAALCGESFNDAEFNEDSSGFYTHYYTTVWGCDSVYYLDFVRYQLFVDTVIEEIMYGDTYIGYGFEENTTGFYEKVHIDINGCDSIYRLDLKVVELWFPNAVTPNGDGINDVFEIVNLLDATLFDYNYILIYDRWGRLIYKKENIRSEEDFWDPNATRTPDGTYFYRFFARTLSHEINHKGVIEVLRKHE